jgi:hypothetical protein
VRFGVADAHRSDLNRTGLSMKMRLLLAGAMLAALGGTCAHADIVVSTYDPTEDTGSTPVKKGSGTSFSFTPPDDGQWDGFFVSGEVDFDLAAWLAAEFCGTDQVCQAVGNYFNSIPTTLNMSLNGGLIGFGFTVPVNQPFGWFGVDEPPPGGSRTAITDATVVSVSQFYRLTVDQVAWSPYPCDTCAAPAGGGPGGTAVPEPRTWLMSLLGFGLMGGLGWRKAQRRDSVDAAAAL